MRTSIVAAVLGCALLAGCGGEGGGGGGGGGLGKLGGGGGSVEGTWTLDLEATLADAKKEALASATTPEEKQQAEAMFGMMAGMFQQARMEIVLKAGGDASFEFSAMGQQSKATGTWEAKGDKVVLTAKTVDGKPAENEDPLELTRSGDRLHAKMGQQGTMVLKRK